MDAIDELGEDGNEKEAEAEEEATAEASSP